MDPTIIIPGRDKFLADSGFLEMAELQKLKKITRPTCTPHNIKAKRIFVSSIKNFMIFLIKSQ